MTHNAPDWAAQEAIANDERDAAREAIARGETARVCFSVPGTPARVLVLTTLEDVERVWPAKRGRRKGAA